MLVVVELCDDMTVDVFEHDQDDLVFHFQLSVLPRDVAYVD